MPPSVLLVILAAGGLLLVDKPFETSRHKEPYFEEAAQAQSSQLVHTRLWQDPIQPVQQDWRKLIKNSKSSIKEGTEHNAGTEPWEYDFHSDGALPPIINEIEKTISAKISGTEHSTAACSDRLGVDPLRKTISGNSGPGRWHPPRGSQK